MIEFSKEQLKAIEAAIDAVYRNSSTGNLTARKVIIELQKPAWTPMVGEVYARGFPARSDWGYTAYEGGTFSNGKLVRPLSYTEIPYFRVALDALEILAHDELNPIEPWVVEIVEIALAEISRLRGES